MITRTFRAPTMPAALKAVQRDLGNDALILSARNVLAGPAWQVWKTPVVEVTAAIQGQANGGDQPADPAASETLPARHRAKTPKTERATLQFRTPALAQVYRRLAAQGVDEEVVAKALASCAEVMGERALQTASLVSDHVRRELAAALTDASRPAPNAAQPTRIVCLVGPSGCGKTTTAAKLAAHHARTLGTPAAWVCADTIRAGAVSQARVYAEALGLPLSVTYTADDLAQAVAEADADLVLVDMPGFNPRREAEVIELGGLLAALPERTTYLVLPATSKEADLNNALSAFGAFNISGLVITKLDETGVYGDVYNAVWRGGLPLAYFATGPRALDDLQPGRAGRLAGALLGEDWAR